jgi:hypothetical protein
MTSAGRSAAKFMMILICEHGRTGKTGAFLRPPAMRRFTRHMGLFDAKGQPGKRLSR